MPSHIALRGLPIENLKRKPFRTGALLAVVTILALTFFGGTMLTMNLNTGMTSMEKRLGADLMVVPQNTVQKAEALLTNGNPSTFYFTKEKGSTRLPMFISHYRDDVLGVGYPIQNPSRTEHRRILP